MPANNWGEVLDAMRGLDSKIATPIKRAIAMIEDLQTAEGALGEARAALAAIDARRAAAVQARDEAVAASAAAQESASAEIARCRDAVAVAQGEEQAAMRRAAAAADTMERGAKERKAQLTEEFEIQALALKADLATLTATRDALATEIADLRRRVGAL